MMKSSMQSPARGPHDLVALVPRINIQAYCDSQPTAETVKKAASDRRMSRAHTSIYPGGIMGAVQAFGSQVTPNLLIVETRSGREAILSELAALADVCSPDTKVIVIGHVNDVILYRELIRQGVSEYMVAPIHEIQLIEVIASLYRDPNAAPLGRAVAFIGAKGGVGSSTIAHNVGFAAARSHDTETVIADLDIAFGTAGLDFNKDVTSSLNEVLLQPDRVDAMFLERLLTKVADKLSLLSGPGGIEGDTEIGPPAIESIVTAMRASIPLTILDIPAQWGAWVRYALLNADQVVITAEPDLASLRNAKSLIDLMKSARPNDAPPRLVLNRVGIPKRPEISAADFSKAINTPVAAAIPFDPQSFGLAQSNGQMMFEVAPKAKATEALTGLVQQLLGIEASAKKQSQAGRSALLEMFAKLRKK